MKRLWALVPLKQLAGAKTRLAEALDATARRELALAMARDVVTALAGARSVQRVVLVSDIPELPQLLGISAVASQIRTGARGLNEDLSAAAGWATREGATHVLIAHADLPLLDSAAVDRFAASADFKTLRAAGCRQGSGTNLLLAPLPLPLPLVFGHDSLARFRRVAGQAGLTLEVMAEPALASDVDDVADYETLLELCERKPRWYCATATFLRSRSTLLASSHA